MKPPESNPAFSGSSSGKPLRLLAVFLFLLLVPGLAMAVDYGMISVNADPNPPGENTHGYNEYRVVVANRSQDTSRKVLLELSQDYSGGGESIQEISRTVSIGPSTEVMVSLFHPAIPFGASGIRVTIDGYEQEERVPLRVVNPKSYYRERIPFVLLSREFKQPDLETMFDSKSKSYDPDTLRFTTATLPTNQWSSNWHHYTRYDGIILTKQEFVLTPAPIQMAMWRYVEAGGSLLIEGRTTIPDPWTSFHTTESDILTYHVGFGRCLFLKESGLEASTTYQRDFIKRVWTETFTPWGQMNSQEEINRRFPVSEDSGIPFRSLYLLTFLFALLIGPVNLIVLTIKRRKIWIFWTVPLIAFFASAAIFGYASWAEGWGVLFRTVGFTILDEYSRRATTISLIGCYSPYTSSDGFHFSPETNVTFVNDFDRYNRSSRNLYIDWTQDQHFREGWISARVPIHLHLRKSETRRERLSVRKNPDGTLTAVNGLGARITRLLYRDTSGKWFSGNGVKAGGEMALRPDSRSSGSQLRAQCLVDVYQSEWSSRIPDLMKYPEHYMFPGTYLAEFEDSPFLEDALKVDAQKKQYWVVLGITKGTSDEAGSQ